MKTRKEWLIEAPWGKISLISWGNPSGTPVLLVHGNQDSAITFVPLLKYLPNTFYYVGIDLPGHGSSDPLPISVMLTRLHFLAGIEYAVKHLKWDRFIYMAHSMGCELGLFYSAVHLGKITKFILLDPIRSIQRLLISDYHEYYSSFYEKYYKHYKENNRDDRVYTKKKAVESVMRARGLTEEQAELILSKNLRRIGEDMYKLTWDKRLKLAAPQNFPLEYYYQLFSNNIPSLIISATNGLIPELKKRNDMAKHLFYQLQKNSDCFIMETVEGGHDVHLTDPGVVANYVLGFLNNKGKAKL